MNTVVYIIVFVVYIGAMIGIGAYFFGKNKSIADYILGGRNLGPWATSLSAQASDMSGWLLLGLPGMAYALYGGTTEAIWVAVGLAVGTYLNWLIVSKRLRVYTLAANDSITLPDYFENRFQDKKKVLRVVSAAFIAIFFLVYTAAQFAAGAKLFSAVFGLGYTPALIIGSVIIVSYTFLGGFMAVCWTDVVQGILMFLALIIVPVISVGALGGVQNTILSANQIAASEGAAMFSLFPRDAAGGISLIVLISSLAWGLGYCGQPHIITRFMAVKKPSYLRPARVIATIWVLVTLSFAVIVGVLGRVYIPETLADSERVFMALVEMVFRGSPIIIGILMTAILAAIMSTADSQLLVTSSAIANDIYAKLLRKKASSKELMLVMRLSVVIVSVLAFLIALDPNSSVFGLVSNAWAGFGATFGPCIIISLFWKRMTRPAAYAGMISGGVSVIIWMTWLKQIGGFFALYELFPAFVISCAAIVIVTLLGKPDKALAEQHEKVLEMAKQDV